MAASTSFIVRIIKKTQKLDRQCYTAKEGDWEPHPQGPMFSPDQTVAIFSVKPEVASRLEKFAIDHPAEVPFSHTLDPDLKDLFAWCQDRQYVEHEDGSVFSTVITHTHVMYLTWVPMAQAQKIRQLEVQSSEQARRIATLEQTVVDLDQKAVSLKQETMALERMFATLDQAKDKHAGELAELRAIIVALTKTVDQVTKFLPAQAFA